MDQPVETQAELDELFSIHQERPGTRELLEDFSKYDVSMPDEIIHSTDEGSRKMWVRKGSFEQLGQALYMALEDKKIVISDRDKKTVNDFLEYIYGEDFKDKKRVDSSDIQKALDMLNIFGIDTEKQREGLKKSLDK